jgi:hypothetical protein
MRCAASLVLITVLTAGCGERPAPPAQRGVLDGQLQGLDKARGVEQTLQDQADQRLRALDDAERR